jgi:diguanylate cyclase (GGDEF)-like protein/PAS domain S-box-containing protein
MKRWREHALVVTALAALAAAGALASLRTSLLDWRFAQAQRDPTGQVVVVAIDTASLSAVGVWPWPRSIHAQLLTKLLDAGAGEVAFDVDFSSRTTSTEDGAFAQALAATGGSAILPVFKQLNRAADGTGTFVSTRPLPEFADNAWLGAVNVSPDPDGRARRYFVGLDIDGAYYPSLASLLAGTPDQSQRDFLLDFSIDIRRIPRLSALDVLEGRAGDLTGKKVIVGATAIELGDHFAAPKYGIVAGVDLQALAADSGLQGRMLQQTGWPVTLLGLVAIALLASFVRRRAPAAKSSALLVATAIILETAAQAVQAATPWSIDTTAWLIALLGYGTCIWVRELDLRGVLASVAQRRFQSIAVTLADGVICMETDGRVTFWNPAAVSIFALPPSSAQGRRFSEFIKGGQAALDSALQARSSGDGVVELTGLRQDGREFPLELRSSVWEAEHGSSVSVIVRDVTARRRSEARIRHLALHDSLTGLANRSSLCDDIRLRIERAAPEMRFAVLLLDLDNFKEVNDKLGHDGGDVLLRRFADALTALLPETDCIARLGGDEFALVCDVARTPLDEIVRGISDIFGTGDRYTFVDGRGFLLSASIGSACFPADGGTVDDLLSHSDLALYRAKSSGRAQHVAYAPAFKAEVDSRRALEADLRRAHAQGEFLPYFQPQARLSDDRIVGVEALIRWVHPEHGLVQPGQFLPVLTPSPIAAEVGFEIMRKACAQGAIWAAAGHEIRIGVNLFPSQFTQGLPTRLAAILAETGLPPRLLEIEITENILLTDDEKTIALLRDVRDLGVCVALDDFGTGYASLTHLKRFPLDRLKIDRSFVTTFGTDPADTAIVTAIVGLARDLGLQTISEGIEDAECARLLRAAGCGEGQGYHYGRPMTGPDCTRAIVGIAQDQTAA